MTTGTPLKPTPSVLKGLQIVTDAGDDGIRPREFARLMWPDSPGWQRYAKAGYGAHRGGGMYRTGGAFLARLHHAGLTRHTYNYQYDTAHAITPAGREFLEANR